MLKRKGSGLLKDYDIEESVDKEGKWEREREKEEKQRGEEKKTKQRQR
jgi:hypothetical protein